MIHVDFSENYVCKMSEEIQSMHFGASKRQITLHTGIYYVGSPVQSQSFCTVSDSLSHGSGAIRAHLEPVLVNIKKAHPNVEQVHVVSEGLTTQYRQ